MLCTCETQGTQHMISIQKLRFSSRLRAEVRTQWSRGAWESTACNTAAFICSFFYYVFVFLEQSNIALFKPTSQSSTYSDWRSYPASNAVNGNRGTHVGKCTHTNEDNSPWWRVDLERVEPVVEVNIVNRYGAVAGRLDGAEIRVGR